MSFQQEAEGATQPVLPGKSVKVRSRSATLQQIIAVTLLLVFVKLGPCWAEPYVAVATLSPIHSLLSQVMEGISQPHLLLNPNKSPHTYQMRPSDAAAIRKASIIFRIGPDLEVFLNKSLAYLADRPHPVRVVNLIDSPELQRYAARADGPLFDVDGHNHNHSHPSSDTGIPRSSRMDTHIWLDPHNAKAIVRTMAAHLSELDPDHRSAYNTNLERALIRLQALDDRAMAMLNPLRTRPFVVFHDAYQYLERRYQLTSLGAMSNLAIGASSARRLERLQQEIQRLHVRCVFVEPQFDAHIAAKLTAIPNVSTHKLDPIGADVPPGPNAYVVMMENNILSLVTCLSESPG